MVNVSGATKRLIGRTFRWCLSRKARTHVAAGTLNPVVAAHTTTPATARGAAGPAGEGGRKVSGQTR